MANITDVDQFDATIEIPTSGQLASANDIRDKFVQKLANRTRWLYNRLSSAGTAASERPNVQEFTSSGTWTKPTWATYCRVICIGTGGGGGTGSTTGGGGGGSGQFIDRTLLASALGATVTVTVGSPGTVGVAGGSVTFGAHVTALGGGRGGNDGGSGGGGGASGNGSSSAGAARGNGYFEGGDPGVSPGNAGRAGPSGNSGGGSRGASGTGGSGGGVTGGAGGVSGAGYRGAGFGGGGGGQLGADLTGGTGGGGGGYDAWPGFPASSVSTTGQVGLCVVISW